MCDPGDVLDLLQRDCGQGGKRDTVGLGLEPLGADSYELDSYICTHCTLLRSWMASSPACSRRM